MYNTFDTLNTALHYCTEYNILYTVQPKLQYNFSKSQRTLSSVRVEGAKVSDSDCDSEASISYITHSSEQRALRICHLSSSELLQSIITSPLAAPTRTQTQAHSVTRSTVTVEVVKTEQLMFTQKLQTYSLKFYSTVNSAMQ